MQYDVGQAGAAEATLLRTEALLPRIDAPTRARLAARRADLACLRGDAAAAREQAQQVTGNRFYRLMAERLAGGDLPGRRVLLPVGFVRQHWNTCAPATLTALAQHWGRAVQHLEVAEAICYDGTAASSERRWAHEQGWHVREFTVDWPTACALIDANVPFTLTTHHGSSGHLQAVIGYDAWRGSLLIRDPRALTHTEYEASSLFEQQAVGGPRGMLILPPERAGEIARIALPDAAAWDHYHALQDALQRHDRQAGQAALAALREQHDGHRLHLFGERSLAAYDGNEPELLPWTERLLARFPKDTHLQLSKAASLWSIGGRAQHIEWLATLAGAPWPDPVAVARYADRLSEDARALPRAAHLVRQALRRAPMNAALWGQLALLTWMGDAHEAALPLYRAASCLADTDEDRASAYHRACHFTGRTEDGVAYLRQRVARLGPLSSAPSRTLFEQLEKLDRTDEAFAVLDAALAAHPDDAALRHFAAEQQLHHGRIDRARALLGADAPSAHQLCERLRVQGLLAEAEHDFERAHALAQDAAALEPLNSAPQRALARQIQRRLGREAALAQVAAAAARHPHHYGLQRLLYDWLPDDAERINTQLAHIAATHPGDAWVQRERAVQAARQQRHDDALRLADEAVAQAGWMVDAHATLAFVKLEAKGYDAAAPHLRDALARDCDNDYAARTLITLAPDSARERAGVEALWQALNSQVTLGDGVYNLQRFARHALPGDELLARLEQLRTRLPGLWHTWWAQATQLEHLQRHEDALALYDAAMQRFPSLPRLHLDRAETLRQLGRRSEAATSAERALALSPAWNEAVRLVVDAVTEADRDWPHAERVLRHALAYAPQDADLQGLLAWVMERADRHESALEQARVALQLDPLQGWVWNVVRRCDSALGGADRVNRVLQAIEQQRPGDADVQLARAQIDDDNERALQAAERVIARRPRSSDAWRVRLERLMALGRHAEVERLASALPWPDAGPTDLRVFAARAQRAAGEPVQAGNTLRRLLGAAPNDYALWREAADGHDHDNEHEQYVEAAREMVRLAPHAAAAHGYLGHALIKRGQPDAALMPLARALTIEPSYRFAALRLGEIATIRQRAVPARSPIEAAWQHGEDFALACAGLRVACLLGERESAKQWLARVVALGAHDVGPTREAIEGVRNAGWGDDVRAVVEPAMLGGACATGAALDWCEQAAKERRGSVLARAEPLLHQEKGLALKLGLLRWLVEQRQVQPLLRFIERWDHVLRADGIAWGQTSWALLQFDRYSDTVVWQHDWREQPDPPVFALTNLALAHGSLGRFGAANDVAERILARSPQDTDAWLWRCVHLTLSGRCDEASALAATHEARSEPWLQLLYGLLHGYWEAVRSGDSARAVSAFKVAPAASLKTAAWSQLRTLLRARLVWRQTRWWLRPWRWLQLDP